MNILIIEDDEYLAERIRKTFESRIAANRIRIARSFLEFVREMPAIGSYDIFLTDLRLDDERADELLWYRVIRTIREKGISAPVVVISGFSEIDRLRAAFEIWASDYLIKPLRLKELELRILNWYKNHVLSGKEARESKHWYGKLAYDFDRNEFQYESSAIPLSRGNKYVLSVFFRNPEKLLGDSYLAEKIWGDVCPSEKRNVRVNVLRLKRALEPFHLDGWISNVRGEGYFFSDPGISRPPRRTPGYR